MTNFADWLSATADMQRATQTMQSQFRLSEREMRDAVEALAPAMMIGLKRLYSNQAAFADMASRFSSMPLGSGMAGQTAMQGLFGSDALADAIARQASTMSGLTPDTLSRMMPTLSAMTMQAFMRSAGPANAFPGDSAGALMAEMMRRSANAVEAFSRPSHKSQPPATPADAMSRVFSQALQGFPWPFMPPSPPRQESPEQPPEPAPKAAPNAAPGRGQTPFDTAFDMLDAGRTLQAGYIREMMSLFDRHSSTTNKDTGK